MALETNRSIFDCSKLICSPAIAAAVVGTSVHDGAGLLATNDRPAERASWHDCEFLTGASYINT